MTKRPSLEFEDEDLQWRQRGFRQGRDVLLACGQVLAREAGFTRAAPGAPLLFNQILSPESTWPASRRLRSDLKPFLDKARPGGASGYLGLSLAVLQDFQEWEAPLYGRFADCRIEGPALVAMLAAGYLLEGAGNGFSDLPRFFSLLDPSPSAWLEILLRLEKFVDRACEPLLFTQRPAGSSAACYSTRFGLTPVGMALMGIPPADTRAPKRQKSGDRQPPRTQSQLFPDDPPDQEAQPPKNGKKDKPPDPPEKKPPQPADLPADLLAVEKPSLALEDLVLPEDARFELDFLAQLLRKTPEAAPVMLFHGPPGTGKTHGARCLAGELGRPLGTVSLDRVIIKWIGDTEKALRKVFDEAAAAGSVLLLDEADALLLDRAGMSQSWQLSQVNTLLKLLEAPPVPVVLCTNFLRLLDPAVHRRIQHLVEFPAPGPEERRHLWALELDAQGVEEDLDLDALAALPLTGGLIHNAVVQFARRKAVYGDGFYADTPTLLALARKELPKMGQESRRRIVGFAPEEGTAAPPAPPPKPDGKQEAGRPRREIRNIKPAECALWKAEELSSDLLEGAFEEVRTYREGVGLSRALVRCRECGHLYVRQHEQSVSLEFGWESFSLIFVPVDDEASADALNGLAPDELRRFVALHVQSPLDGDEDVVVWVREPPRPGD